MKGSGAANANITVRNDGTFSSTSLSVSPAFDAGDEWLPVGTPADWDVMLQYVSGDHLTSGTENTWLNCGTNRTFEIAVAGASANVDGGTFNLLFRFAGTGSAVSSSTLTLTAGIS